MIWLMDVWEMIVCELKQCIELVNNLLGLKLLSKDIYSIYVNI